MMRKRTHSVLLVLTVVLGASPAGAVEVVRSEVLGPFTGPGAELHPDNLAPQRIRYYGTDLGFSYVHDGQLHFLFGDTWAVGEYEPIEAQTGGAHDDGFGTIDLDAAGDPASFAPGKLPPIRLGQHPDSAEMMAMDPGQDMSLGKTPMAGFSNGKDQFALFLLGKPQGCTTDADCDGLACDTALGYFGTAFDEGPGITVPCADGSSFLCRSATIEGEPDSGLCVDRTGAGPGLGLFDSMAQRVRVATRGADQRSYAFEHDWLTNKFANVTDRPVADFRPERAARQHDYRLPDPPGEHSRLLLWGRPGFAGIAAHDRSLGLYFGYVDLPRGPGFDWDVQYFSGLGDDGRPQFSSRQQDARALDLDAGEPGWQTAEQHDLVQQMSVAWVAPLGKWVMLYGGSLNRVPRPGFLRCGVMELFTGPLCGDVVEGNGGIRLRTADHPWGPWSAPQDVLAAGDPAADPPVGQFAPGGLLRHPACEGDTCAPHSPNYAADEYGFFYSANIIEPWTHQADGGVYLYWNVSTWDPYGVALVRTLVRP